MKKIIKRYEVRNNIEVVIEEIYSAGHDDNDFYVYGRQKIFFCWKQITLAEHEYNLEDAIETAKRIKKQLLRLV